MERAGGQVRRLGVIFPLMAASLLLGSCGGPAPKAPQKAAAGGTVRAAADLDLAARVNPLIGTQINPNLEQCCGGAVGNTFPGATLPFGMVQFSPDTGYGEVPGLGGYSYDKSNIQGFSLTHASGAGCGIMQDVPFLPIVGNVTTSPGTNIGAYAPSFSHSNEQAKPGYYQVGLGNGVNAELTASKRSALGRFGYPSTNDAGMIINVGKNGVGTRSASLEIVGNNVVQGSLATGGVCGGGGYILYFYAEFDRSFSSFGTYQGSSVNGGSRTTTSTGKDNGGWVKFSGSGGQIKMRAGVSYVSIANAKLNMQTEDPNWDFDGLRNAARSSWNAALNKVQVSGGTSDEQTIFYSAMYHTLMHPNIFSDVDGRYIGFDNKIYTASGWDKYATYSGWDIYRSQVQWLGWLFPKEAGDMAQSLVVDADKGGGGLPKWPTNNDDTCVMAGDAGAIMVANFYAFGGKNFDTASALRFMELGANQPGTRSRQCEIRPGLSDYLSKGYLPISTNTWGPTSTTLEYALADGAIAQFAGYLGDAGKRDTYLRRANNWKNLYNKATGYIQGKDSSGNFTSNFSRTSQDGYVEGNAATYVWMVPQNYRGLFNAMGGNAEAIRRLDEHYSTLNGKLDNPYAFLGNEPEHNTPWAYNFAGAPYKTQALIRRIENEQYVNGPNGEPGNDDLGATSARLIWGQVGLYPVIPGLGGFTVNGPRFPTTVIRMSNGKTLTINAQGAARGNPYIQSMKLNGQNRTSTWISLTDLNNDTTIDYVMGSSPNTSWGSASSDAPPSFDTAPATGGGIGGGGSGTCYVTLYTDINYGGASLCFNTDPGANTLQLGYLGNDWNDRVSSVKVAPGYEFTLFSDADFVGNSLACGCDVPDFGPYNFNDVASSIRYKRKQ